MNVKRRKLRVGLALGSGLARGWAHIGVLRALAQVGIEPDVVCGSSIGALIGAAYAAGQLDALEQWAYTLSWRRIVRYMDVALGSGGFFTGAKLMEFLQRGIGLGGVAMENLPKRFAAVATELHTGREVWLQEGPLLDAVRASIAVPGVLTPFRRGEDWLVDGGLVNPVPVSVCRAMGADTVIAVNLNGDLVTKYRRYVGGHGETARKSEAKAEAELWEKLAAQLRSGLQERAALVMSQLLGPREDLPGISTVLTAAINIMQDRITRSRMGGDPPDVLLAPRLAHIGLLEFDRARDLVEEGARSVERMLPALKDTTQS